MSQRYQIKQGKESLEVSLSDELPGGLQVVWRNGQGQNHHVSIIRNGEEIRRTGFYFRDKSDADPEKDEFIVGYVKAFETLGPRLREQLPEDWQRILGNFLSSSKK